MLCDVSLKFSTRIYSTDPTTTAHHFRTRSSRCPVCWWPTEQSAGDSTLRLASLPKLAISALASAYRVPSAYGWNCPLLLGSLWRWPSTASSDPFMARCLLVARPAGTDGAFGRHVPE